MKKIEVKDLYGNENLILFHTNTNRMILGYVRSIHSSIEPSILTNGTNHLIGFRYISETESDIYNNGLLWERTLSAKFLKNIFAL